MSDLANAFLIDPDEFQSEFSDPRIHSIDALKGFAIKPDLTLYIDTPNDILLEKSESQTHEAFAKEVSNIHKHF